MMKEKNYEEMKWENPNEGVITVVEFQEVADPAQNGEIIGINKSEASLKTTYTKLNEGYTLVKDRNDSNLEKLQDLKSNLELLGGNKPLSSELVRLRKNIGLLEGHNKVKQINAQLESLNKQIETDSEMLTRRGVTLATRPEVSEVTEEAKEETQPEEEAKEEESKEDETEEESTEESKEEDAAEEEESKKEE